MLIGDYLSSSFDHSKQSDYKLSGISSTKIKTIKKRINFYISHFRITIKSAQHDSKKSQLAFLLNLQTLLDDEMQCRDLELQCRDPELQCKDPELQCHYSC